MEHAEDGEVCYKDMFSGYGIVIWLKFTAAVVTYTKLTWNWAHQYFVMEWKRLMKD